MNRRSFVGRMISGAVGALVGGKAIASESKQTGGYSPAPDPLIGRKPIEEGVYFHSGEHYITVRTSYADRVYLTPPVARALLESNSRRSTASSPCDFTVFIEDTNDTLYVDKAGDNLFVIARVYSRGTFVTPDHYLLSKADLDMILYQCKRLVEKTTKNA